MNPFHGFGHTSATSVRSRTRGGYVVAVVMAATAILWGVASADAAPSEGGAPALKKKAKVRVSALTRPLDPRKHRLEDGRLVADLPKGRTAVLNLDPGLQGFAERLLERYEVPYAGLVAVEPKTGKLLAYVSHSSAEPNADDWASNASAPAASVFKLITGAALIEEGLTPRTTTCYHGGLSGLTASHLRDDADRDKACVSLGNALGRSVNAVFAKRAVRHLSPGKLERYASAFGFGHALPFDLPVEASASDVPDEKLEFARTAAGFWHMHMSPLHGAMIAATIANRGRMMRPQLVEEVRSADGRVVAAQKPKLFRSVVERRTADLLGKMMTNTTRTGTARKTFHDAKGNAFLPGITVAGKTGTLSRERPYRGYTWFVGFAPADDPKIAIAALLVNSPKWRIKGVYAAREALRYYLVEQPRAERVRAREAARLSKK